MSMVISLENIHDFRSSRDELGRRFGGRVAITGELGAVSLIGNGINSDNAHVRRLLDLVQDEGVGAIAVSTSSFRITALVPAVSLRGLVASCHKAFIGGYVVKSGVQNG
jgi:aspartokinase